jgi:hypothetical protein
VDSSKLITQSGNNTKANPNSCTSNLSSNFVSYGDAQTSVLTSLTPEQFVTEIKKETNNVKLQVIIYLICYVKTFESGKFNGYNNNFANITLTTNDYGESVFYFTKNKYSCLNISNLTPEKTSQPIATFDTITKFLQFMISRLTRNLERFTDEFLEYGITNYYVCEWPVPTGVSQEYFTNNLSQYKKLDETFQTAFRSIPDVKLPVDVAQKLNKTNKNQLKSIENTNKGITNSPNNLNTTSVTVTCPPPTINTFSPLTGISGTILTIVGDNLDQVTAVTINNVTTTNNITIINKFNISVIVPFSNTSIPQQDSIIVRGLKGDGISLSAFTYNPQQLTPSTPITPPGLPPNVNTQPQIVVLTANTTTNQTTGGNTNMVITINPVSGQWNILPEYVEWTWTATKPVVGPNNTIVDEKIGQGTFEKEFENNVSGNRQSFSITDVDIQGAVSERVSYVIDVNKNTKIQSKITLVAEPLDRNVIYNVTNNPNDVIRDISQTFSFTVITS